MLARPLDAVTPLRSSAIFIAGKYSSLSTGYFWRANPLRKWATRSNGSTRHPIGISPSAESSNESGKSAAVLLFMPKV